MKCGIVRDLLPSYIDGLTCADSNREVEKHLKTCTECRECYKGMSKKEFELFESEEEQKRDLYVLKSFKKFRRRLISGICIAVIALCAVIYFVGSYEYYMSYDETKVDVILTEESIERVRTMSGGDQIHEWIRGLNVVVPEGGREYELLQKQGKYVTIDGEEQPVLFISCVTTLYHKWRWARVVTPGREMSLTYSFDHDEVLEDTSISDITRVYYLDRGIEKVDDADNEEMLELIEKYGHLVWTKEEGNQSTYYETLILDD